MTIPELTHVRATLGQSERRVCRVLGQARSTQRYRAVARDGDEALVRRIHELVRHHPRRGYRMIWGMPRLEGCDLAPLAAAGRRLQGRVQSRNHGTDVFLASPRGQYIALWERRRLDLTVEALVLTPEFAPLFTEAEQAIARRRLGEYGHSA